MNLILKTGDTAPTQQVRLVGRDGPANLVGATVSMQVDGRDGQAFPVTIIDAENGVVQVARGDLNVPNRSATRWRAEFEVTYAGGLTQTFPEDGYLTVTVWSDLDDR
jgi:hypothetical protein